MNASSRSPHRRVRAGAPGTVARPVSRPAAPPHNGQPVAPAPPSDRVLLIGWTSVFPLSTGPAERVRRHAATQTGVENLAHATASYVRALDDRVPAACTVDADGNLLGPPDFAADAGDVLFRAVFTTDLDAVLGRPGTQ